MVIVTGMTTGTEESNGTIVDEKTGDKVPWAKSVLVLLEGTRTREIRLDKGWTGPIPKPGEHVAVECSFGYGNKLHGVRLLPDEVAKHVLAAA